MIKKLIIHNYKLFEDFDLDFDKDLNIIVGDNESGKSTILEAINLVLSKQLNGRFLENELSPYLFNSKVVSKYLIDLKSNLNPQLPSIFIELYFDDDNDLELLRGSNNFNRENKIGIKLEVIFNDEYKDELEELLKEKGSLNLIPAEFYKVEWQSFAGNPLSIKGIPIKASFIDATTIRLQNGADLYLQNIINSKLEPKERVALSIQYRKLKEDFANQESISLINQELDSNKNEITDKKFEIAMDVSQRTNWETNLIPHLDSLPFQFSGKGEQSSLKIMLALKKSSDTNIVLVEEPENHLSFSSMNILINRIRDKCDQKQIIIATHSSFVLNKLGLSNLILIKKSPNIHKLQFQDLPVDTQKYFSILPGFDTLRLILAKKAFLVEGPSDELIVQKAFLIKYGKLPIDNGIDVISARGLSFKRFLDIAKELAIEVSVITDNDGDYKNEVEEKYKDYVNVPNIKIVYDKDDSAPTLEPQLIKANGVDLLNKIFELKSIDEESLKKYMANNKTDCALKLFETTIPFKTPEYIQDAI